MLLMAHPRANSLARVKAWLDRLADDRLTVFFIIAARRGNRPLGYVQLTHMDLVHGTADLGICLDETSRGKGYAAEALQLLEDYVRDVFNLRKIVLRVLASNAPAIAFYKKARYRQVGVHKQHFYQARAFHDVLVMEKMLARSSAGRK
jgi:RimJ/RimL family protein N-acetyltransferase